MPAYHSKIDPAGCQEACGCSLLPLKTKIKGPAPPVASDEEDIIDETIKFFRANIFFRNFEVKNGSDRVLVYLTLFVGEVSQRNKRLRISTESML
mmetsp:Transcript_52864/g.120502  ORF Transcript_52864/g.120502 Transcript_52864/m.120502 type:complete len:95 (+) Transcript_52864:85-369(+)